MRPALPALALALVACSSAAKHPPLPTALPTDGAPPVPRHFAVGVTSRTFVDRARDTPANGKAPASPQRTLATEIWYPADAPARAPETRDAPLLAAAGAAPLVLFVHGSSGYSRQSTFLTQALASRGFVVAAADFPLTVLTQPGGESDWHVEDQLGDLAFLADRLFAASADPNDSLHGALDAALGYGVVGHSTGGAVALLAAEAPAPHDPRVFAAVALSGDSCFYGDGFFSTRAVPLLVVGATRDLIVPNATNSARSYALAKTPAVGATLVGGTHLFFTDVELPDDLGGTPTTLRDPLALTLARYGGGTGCEPFPRTPNDPPLAFEDQHALTIAVVRPFLDAALRGEGADLASIEVDADPRLGIVNK